jgi:hypothetical protein
MSKLHDVLSCAGVPALRAGASPVVCHRGLTATASTSDGPFGPGLACVLCVRIRNSVPQESEVGG